MGHVSVSARVFRRAARVAWHVVGSVESVCACPLPRWDDPL